MVKVRNWEKKIDDPCYIKYYNEKAEKILLIEKIERDSIGRVNFWQVSVGGSVSRVSFKSYIRTKKQAQRIALSWMKQHPNG